MPDKDNTIIIYKIISSAVEEAILVAAVLWGLPLININLPLWVLIPATIVLQTWNVFSYLKTIQALRAQPVIGLADMVGSQGVTIDTLSPEGMVKIRGELWKASAVDGNIATGQKIMVVGQKGLRLAVRTSNQPIPINTSETPKIDTPGRDS